MGNNLSLEHANLFMALVKERFHGKTAETFDRFKAIVVKCGQELETVDRSAVLEEVRDLFGKHHDLVEKFKGILFFNDHNRASKVEKERNFRRSVPPDKKSVKIVVNSCLDFVSKVERVLKDDVKFKSFLMVISEFQEHMDVERVEREVFCLFNEHPELEIEFTEFLAEANVGRTVQDMVVCRTSKRKEAQKRTHRCEDREFSQIESHWFDAEDGWFKRDLAYNLMVRAKEGADSLIMDNLGRRNLKEEIWIAGYFRGLNVEFMRTELKLKKFLDKCKLLSEKSMAKGKALEESQTFIRFMKRKIEILTKDWDEKRRRFINMSDERDLQIPVFDWYAEQ